MKIRIVVLVLFGLISFSSNADDSQDAMVATVASLNEASLEWLGISLGALAFLSESGEGSYIPKSHLDDSKKIELVKQLKLAGYVETQERTGLPDGQEPNETFIRLVPTEKGLLVIASVKVISHTKRQ